MKHFIKNLNAEQGIATLEILIAMAILVMVITSVLPLVSGSQDTQVSSQTDQEALYKAEQALEDARAKALADFSSLASVSSSVEGIYTKSLTVTPSQDQLTKDVTSQVTWNGTNKKVQLTTKVTDWQSAFNGDHCSQTLIGDWSAPQIYGYVDFSSPSGATGVSVRGTRAYITSDPNSSTTDDFYVVDVSNPSPAKGQLTTLGHFSTTYGLTDIRVVGNYAYVAADSTQNQLLVIDVSDPASLKIVKKIDLTASGDTAVGNTVAYANKKIYLGLTKSSTGREFYTFDISDPANPAQVGSYEVDAVVNSIMVKDSVAYLATAASDEVIALNISIPNPALLQSYNSTTLTGQSVAVDDNTLYFGRIGGNGNPKLLAFDKADITSPTWTMDMSKQSGVYTMVKRNNLLFMTTADPNDGLQIWDVSKATSTVPPVRYDTSPLNIQQTATAGQDCYGNLLFIAQKSNRAMQIVGPYLPSSYALTNSGNITVQQTASGSNTITAAITSGYPQSITFSASGLPSGAAASFSPGNCIPNCQSQLTLSTTLATPAGTYPITVKGTGGITTAFNLIVTAKPPAFDYAFNPTPSDISIKKGQSASNTFTISMIPGATAQSVTVTPVNLPSGITVGPPTSASCSPNSGSCQVQLTFNASTSISGQPSLTITVNGNSPAHSTSFKLKVNN